jgi:ferredoxin-thioredoxin reductase catalytic subunit
MVEKSSLIDTMKKNAKDNGYFLCPDQQLFDDLIEGISMNTTRYGYGSCPCRIASGSKKNDVDIICPCEYRDADVDEFGMCYCGLFVNEKVKNNPSLLGPIPERRPQEVTDAAFAAAEQKHNVSKEVPSQSNRGKKAEGVTIWRCTVCGYLCARELPPPICPICKAKAERFEVFTVP